MKKIVIDVMGADSEPKEIIRGVIDALKVNNKINVILVGKEEEINRVLEKESYDKSRVYIKNATEIIDACDNPTRVLKEKKDSSMVVGLNLVKSGEGECLVSCGNTGALMAGATLIVGRIKGIKRPGFGALIPNKKGYYLLLDCGANLDPKPEYLKQYGILGSIYIEEMLNIKNPSVKLVNIGEEKSKGTDVIKEAYELLENTPINFQGNIEARDIPFGDADVVICDAFTGNVILKLTEGFAKSLFEMLREEFMKKSIYKIGALLSKPVFNNLKKKMDYKEHGGAPMLGLKSLVVKSHGNSDARAIKGAVLQCQTFIDKDITNKIIKKIEES